jgi:hypothetical protein
MHFVFSCMVKGQENVLGDFFNNPIDYDLPNLLIFS